MISIKAECQGGLKVSLKLVDPVGTVGPNTYFNVELKKRQKAKRVTLQIILCRAIFLTVAKKINIMSKGESL
jgi:hypothetical protein